jgi:hypothetical protein
MRRLTMMGGLAALATLASASTCYDANNYIVTPASAKARLQLSSSSPTVPADGFSRVTITAQVDTTADATRRSVKFTTTAGRLVGGPDIVADASGVATVELESAVPEQNATVRADVNGVAGLAQSIVVKFIAVIPDAIIKFITLPKAAIADGDELETIAVQIGAGVPTDKRSVKFTASSGTFPNNAPTIDVVPDAANVATITLRAPVSVGKVSLRAQVLSFPRDSSFTVGAALPDTILVDPGKFTLASTEETTVKAHLQKATGIASKGTVVVFEAFDTLNQPVPQFRAQTVSDDKGDATAVFRPIAVEAKQTITIRASIPGTNKVGVATLVVAP